MAPLCPLNPGCHKEGSVSDTLCTLSPCLIFDKYSPSTYRNFVFNKEKTQKPKKPWLVVLLLRTRLCMSQPRIPLSARGKIHHMYPGCGCRLPFPILPPWGMHLVLKATKIKKLKGAANRIGLSQGSHTSPNVQESKACRVQKGLLQDA